MFDALYVGGTGMIAHQTLLDTISNNLANLNTIGFRRGLVTFADVSAQLSASVSSKVPWAATDGGASPANAGAGSVAQLALSVLPGTLQQTNGPLDVGINGSGFFEVIRADGTDAYSRAGSLEVNADGLLALADGTPLAAQIQVPPDASNVTIGADGQVTALVGGSATPMLLGRIMLANFPNPAALTILGNNQYAAPAAAGSPQTAAPGSNGFGQLQQGYLESSDVDLNQEMTNLLLAQRGFELNSKIVQSADLLWSLTNGLVRS